MKIGFACKYVHPDRDLKPKILKETEQPLNCRSTTVRWLNEQHPDDAEERLWELMSHNIQSLYNLVSYVARCQSHYVWYAYHHQCYQLPLKQHGSIFGKHQM